MEQHDLLTRLSTARMCGVRNDVTTVQQSAVIGISLTGNMGLASVRLTGAALTGDLRFGIFDIW